MNSKIILLKYGEVVMKGLNRSYFDNLIIKRVRYLLKTVDGEFSLDYAQSTLCIRGDENADMDTAFEKMKTVFGIASVCLGFECEKSMEAVCRTVSEHMDTLIGGAKTFKCVGKRSDKRFPLNSPQICAEVGGIILEAKPYLKVDVNDPEVSVYIEIRDKYACVHGGGEKGACGMPAGSAGHGLLLLSGGIDSPVAGYLAAKRGLAIDAVYFESPPYTGEAAKQKVVDLATKLSELCGRIYLHTVSVTEIQEVLMEKCDERMFTLLLRRFMVRLAERTARSVGAEALITGESLGQVASQTLQSIAVTNAAAKMPIFRPCITMDKDDIVVQSRKIGTFDISILPYEDCCTVFVPKHPNIRPELDKILEEEAKIPVDDLVDRAFETKTVIRIG